MKAVYNSRGAKVPGMFEKAGQFQDFFGAFVRPSVPLGWRRVDTQVESTPRQADSTNGALNK